MRAASTTTGAPGGSGVGAKRSVYAGTGDEPRVLVRNEAVGLEVVLVVRILEGGHAAPTAQRMAVECTHRRAQEGGCDGRRR